MKVLHISNYIFPHIGGIEQTARDIVNSISSFAEQRVICFNGGKETVTDELDGVPIVRCGTLLKVSSQAISSKFNKQLKKQFAEFKPEVVIFHYPNPFEAHYLIKYLKKNPSCKLILWWHLDITKQKILGKLFKGQTEKLLKRADKIVATSPNYLASSPFLARYREKCSVIPSCINEERLKLTDEIASESESIRNKNNGKTICFAVGRHVPYKGYEYLIKASALLDDGYKIYLAGEGELTQKLKALAGDDEKIEFLGRLSDDEMKAYMAACDIYCFPSITRNEAFGLALAEAMSFGKPAVTFTIEGSGVNYVNLNGVTGLEVENANSEKYAEAIETLAHDGALRGRYGSAAKKRVEELFSSYSFGNNVRALLNHSDMTGSI